LLVGDVHGGCLLSFAASVLVGWTARAILMHAVPTHPPLTPALCEAVGVRGVVLPVV
jgi:hypothetical protein